MRFRSAILLILFVLLADQVLKIYVKTHFLVGESHLVLGQWFRLNFIENDGMAAGIKLHSSGWGKITLTVFRLGAVIFGTFYIRKLTMQGHKKGFIICVSLIYAGALGNLIDSLFYGMIFDKGMFADTLTGQLVPYDGLAKFSLNGYGSFLMGNVVDMLFFPLIHTTFPHWLPYIGGKPFDFFNFIFNISDASISIGIFFMLILQKRFFKGPKPSLLEAKENNLPS